VLHQDIFGRLVPESGDLLLERVEMAQNIHGELI